MAVAVIQEFPIEGTDRTTTNYDRILEALGTRENPPAGGLVHTAGFDDQAGVFRIFDVGVPGGVGCVLQRPLDAGGQAADGAG